MVDRETMNDNDNDLRHAYDDYHFIEDESILMGESIQWAYRPGRVLMKSLYIDMDDVNIGEDVLEQFAQFRMKTIGFSWVRLYKFIKMRGEMNKFRQDMRITKQYMKYELDHNGHSEGIIDFRFLSRSQLHLVMNLYIFKFLTTYERDNFRDLICNPQMV